MSQNKNSQGLKLAFAGVIAAAVAAGGGVAWWGTQTPKADPSLSEQAPIEQPVEVDIEPPAVSLPDEAETADGSEAPIEEFPGSSSEVSEAPAPSSTASSDAGGTAGDPVAARPDSNASSELSGPSVYWIGSDDNQVQYDAERVAVAPDSGADSQLKTAMEELLAGTEATAIPSGTELLGAEVKGQDVYVDLSNEFTQGGGSAAMAARLGQVIYTATAVEPAAQVWISVEGEPLTELGGEGLLIDQPLNVAKFEEEFDF